MNMNMEPNPDKMPDKEPEVQIPLRELKKIRLRKLEEFRSQGIEPYPYRFDRSHTLDEARTHYERFAAESTVLSLAGRIMLKRKMGKAIFADLHDLTGKMQVYFKIDNVGEPAFNLFDKLDLGDIVGVKGTLFTTRTGEKTVMVKEMTLLAKALHPLPDKHQGLVDKDVRYRRRYADLIINPEVRDIFVKRGKIIKSIRDFLDNRGFIEVETPILQPLYGGAAARPFVTHHNTLDVDLYLRIADELYLKRLIVGGFDKVWEFCKDFRNEGMDRLHNPEFSMVELYWAYADYNDIMKLYEDMMRQVVHDLHGASKINYEGQEIDFGSDFRRVSMVEAIREKTGLDLMTLDFGAALEAAKKAGLDLAGLTNWGRVVEAFFETKVEASLIQPTFIKDFPREISPLAKVHRENPRLTERFEVYIAGQEMGNAFSELNDPVDQLERFKGQAEARKKGDEEAHQLDEDYIRALEYGMPPTGGLGFGIDRLIMLLTDSHSIQEVILFPQMRPEGDVHKAKSVEDLDSLLKEIREE